MISKSIARITMVLPLLSPVALTTLILLGLSSGCTSAAKFDELATQHNLVQSTLARTHEQLELERRTLKDARLENSHLTKELHKAKEGNHTLLTKIEALVTEKNALEAKFHENFKALSKLREKHKKLNGMAQETLAEMSVLRQRYDGLVNDRTRFEEQRVKYRKEVTPLTTEVDNLRIELEKTRAAVRVIQENGDENKDPEFVKAETENERLGDVAAAQKEQIVNLSEEVVALRGRLSKANDGQEAPPVDSVVDPTTLYKSGGALVLDRYKSALTGEITWDTFDTVAVSILGGAVVLFLLSFLFIIRYFRVRRRLKQLQRYVDEIEQEEYEEGDEPVAVQPEAEKRYPAPAPLPPQPRLPRRPSPAPVDTWGGGEEDRLSPNEFSGIMRSRESKKSDAEEPVLDATQILPSSAAPVPAAKPKTKTAPPRKQAAPVATNPVRSARKVIGASAWQEEIATPPEPTGEIPGTQELNAVFDEDAGAQTQIISDVDLGLISGDTGGGDEKTAPKSSRDDQELLSELKSIINKKFDTAMDAERK